jgi:hypothetical protein
MDSNDFIFSDDVAESLGSRMAEADGGELAVEAGEPADGSGKARLVAFGTVGFAVLSLIQFWDRHPHL